MKTLQKNTSKKCTKCQKEKILELFRFRKDRNNFISVCRECEKQIQKKYDIENIEKNKERRKKYREKNKHEISIKNKEYYKENKKKILHRCNKYRLENKEKRRKTLSKYNEKNKNKIKEYHKVYQKREIYKIVMKNSKHKRREIEKKGDVSTSDLLELQKNAEKCYWCNVPLKNIKTHIDHYTPLSKGGKHTLSNLVVTCAKCNLQKNAKDPLEFANSIGKLL